MKLKLPFLVATLFILAQCGGGSSDSSTETEVEDDVAATAGSSSATTSSITSSLGSIGGGGAALVKGAEDDSEDIDFSCAASEDFSTVTCDCPEGGTFTSSYADDAFTIEDCDAGGVSVTFNSTFSQTFDDCVVEECGGTVTLNGGIDGTVDGSFDCNGNEDITADISTGGTCSGMTASPEGGEDINIGFNATFLFDGSEETFSGTFCTDPPGEPDGLIEFSSLDELETAVDPEGTCDAAEAEDEEEEDDTDDDTEDDTEEDECLEACIDSCIGTGADEDTCTEACAEECTE